MQARLSCSAHRRFRRAGHTLRDFNDNYQYGNLLFQQPVGGVSTGFLENSPSTHYYWLPTPQGDILVGFDQGINSYAVYTDHLGTPRLVTKIESPQNPKPITDTSNDLPLADYGQPEGISPLAIPVWQWSYSPFGADLANGYEARPTTMANNFKPDLWSWMGLPETGGADANQVAQETWRIEQNLHIQPVLNIRYPGQYYDFESGLVQNWWRTYEPRIGRYTSADPIGLNGGWNRFAYVEGDGVNGFDPDGLRGLVFYPRPPPPRPNQLLLPFNPIRPPGAQPAPRWRAEIPNNFESRQVTWNTTADLIDPPNLNYGNPVPAPAPLLPPNPGCIWVFKSNQANQCTNGGNQWRQVCGPFAYPL